MNAPSIKLENLSIKFSEAKPSNKSFFQSINKIISSKVERIETKGNCLALSLNSISMEINNGDRLALLGHNGAGKTTLLRTLAGIYEPVEGSIYRSGSIASLLSISLGIHEEATGRENIYIRSSLMGKKKKEIDAKLYEIISFSELGQFIDMPVKTYSSGMKMRLAFSVATAFDADILLMDEWLSVGDKNFKVKAEEKLMELIKRSNILVLASHSETLIRKVCNKGVILEKGNVIDIDCIDLIAKKYFKG